MFEYVFQNEEASEEHDLYEIASEYWEFDEKGHRGN